MAVRALGSALLVGAANDEPSRSTGIAIVLCPGLLCMQNFDFIFIQKCLSALFFTTLSSIFLFNRDLAAWSGSFAYVSLSDS